METLNLCPGAQERPLGGGSIPHPTPHPKSTAPRIPAPATPTRHPPDSDRMACILSLGLEGQQTLWAGPIFQMRKLRPRDF